MMIHLGCPVRLMTRIYQIIRIIIMKLFKSTAKVVVRRAKYLNCFSDNNRSNLK